MILIKPLITVLVTTFNQENYISETLDSILRQKVNVPFFVVLADDCSRDKTGSICDEYASRHPDMVKSVRRPQNLGLIDNSFSALLEECDSKYIACCAGDDSWIDEYKLQKQYDCLEAHTDVSIVHSGYRKFFEEDDTYIDIMNWVSPLQYVSGREAIKYVITHNFTYFPVGSSFMFRGKEITNLLLKHKALYSGKKIPGEAMVLFPFLSLIGKYAYLPDVTTLYRIHKGSASHKESDIKQLYFESKYSLQRLDTAYYYNLDWSTKLGLQKGLFRDYFTALTKSESSVVVSAIEDYGNVSFFSVNAIRLLEHNNLLRKIVKFLYYIRHKVS